MTGLNFLLEQYLKPTFDKADYFRSFRLRIVFSVKKARGVVESRDWHNPHVY